MRKKRKWFILANNGVVFIAESSYWFQWYSEPELARHMRYKNDTKSSRNVILTQGAPQKIRGKVALCSFYREMCDIICKTRRWRVRPEHPTCFDGGRKPVLTLGGQGHSTQKDPFFVCASNKTLFISFCIGCTGRNPWITNPLNQRCNPQRQLALPDRQ